MGFHATLHFSLRTHATWNNVAAFARHPLHLSCSAACSTVCQLSLGEVSSDSPCARRTRGGFARWHGGPFAGSQTSPLVESNVRACVCSLDQVVTCATCLGRFQPSRWPAYMLRRDMKLGREPDMEYHL